MKREKQSPPDRLFMTLVLVLKRTKKKYIDSRPRPHTTPEMYSPHDDRKNSQQFFSSLKDHQDNPGQFPKTTSLKDEIELDRSNKR